MKPKKVISAFTVIELAIVTVVISILITAIIASSDVLDAANRSTIIKEINDYKSSVLNFHQKYEALPGDMENASSYWSGVNNGDGNGYIRGSATENAYAWRHMNKADFLVQNFDGSDITEYMPESKTNDIFFKLDTAGGSGGGVGSQSSNWNLGTDTIYEQSGNYLAVGGMMEGGTLHHSNGFINAKNAQNIDLKIDDGNASAGNFIALKGLSFNGTSNIYLSGCVDGSSNAYSSASEGTINYDLDNDDDSCRLIYFIRGVE